MFISMTSLEEFVQLTAVDNCKVKLNDAEIVSLVLNKQVYCDDSVFNLMVSYWKIYE